MLPTISICRILSKRGIIASSTLTPQEAKSGNILCSPNHQLIDTKTTTTTSVSKGAAMGPHAFHFKLERYFAAAMVPLLPASYFFHGSFMDYALAVAIALHSHWGIMVVVQDYARPIIIGEALAKISPLLVYALSVVLFAGLLLFNYNDIGITKAFEMVFSL